MGFKKQIAIFVQTEHQKEFSGTQELVDSEEGLAGYNRDIVKKMANGLGLDGRGGGHTSKVVEFGAGTGALAEVWRDLFNFDPICVELDPALIEILRTKGFTAGQKMLDITPKISFLYTSNVLEHIEDDVNVLKMIRERMENGGRIAIYVPALPFLFSDLDRKVGHFRRYTKKELMHKVKLAGFQVNDCYYNDSIGVLASIALKLIGFKTKAGLGSKRSLLFYDKYLYPVSQILDKTIFKFLIGKNLLLFATNLQKLD
jgi:SAM-dependent methyltransferase